MTSRSKNIKNNNWLLKLSRGDYGVSTTFGHLVAALLLAVVNYAFMLNFGGVFGVSVAAGLTFFYGLYTTNIGFGFWRLARELFGRVKALLLRMLALFCLIIGVLSMWDGLYLVSMLISILKSS
ncbi:hypothetical protein BIY29_05600 [Brenneria alni]|uniref:Uncharacterized protein n=1 Tax=Brenneria alni TaxID=71656 RepID=A0A421DR28_9GAMM|nr:hypothetical protein [Brenneria alni]RLM26531.1 hypothetical protein BIY29_05600 [Brenneria alni]